MPKICDHCGVQLDDVAKFCKNCGAQQLQPEPEAKWQPHQPDPYANEFVHPSSNKASEQDNRQWDNEQLSASPLGWSPDASTPVLNTWKTSWGFSFLGVLVAAILSSMSVDVIMILFVLSIIYAAIVYPSFFTGKPKLTSNKVISAANLLFGGYIFGAIWNGNLTRRNKGISHIVFIVLSVLLVALMAFSLIASTSTSPSPSSGSQSYVTDQMREAATPPRPPADITPVQPVPAPKPDPQIPSGAIKWTEATTHIGEVVSIYGPVKNVTHAYQSDGSPTFIDIGASYPDPRRVTVVIWGEHRANFPSAPESLYDGKTVCVTGEVYLYQDMASMNQSHNIAIQSPSQIQVIE